MPEITTEMTIAEIIELAPDSVIIMNNAKLGTTGCNANTERTLSEVIQDKKLHPDETAKLLKNLNKLKQTETQQRLPQSEDFELKKINEGNKIYYKLAGLMFTESAYKNLHQLADKAGLRIHLGTGGCSGYKYEFDYYNDPQKSEKIYPLSENLAIYMDDFTFNRSYGSIVDFTYGLHGSGLQIINPNQKRSCSCGTSFSL